MRKYKSMKLHDRQWDAFPIEDIFEILSGRDIYEKERFVGCNPYVTATANQNGIGYFVGNTNDTLEKGCISVNRNGSVGYAFYHPYLALYGNDTRKLKPKHKGHYAYFFLARMITAQKDKFGYGLKLGTDRLKKQKIMLPVDEKGQPDYAFMESYMKAIEKRLLKRYQAYIEASKRSQKVVSQLNGGGKIEYREFTIKDLFNVYSSVRLVKGEMKEGTIPFIGASDSNNGITAFCGNENKSLDSNVLGVNYNGSVVENFYHPYKALFSDDVKRLHLQNHEGNRYIYLYIKSMILQQKDKYQYGYKFNGDRMNRQIILLPVDKENNPDYAYMEQYMKAKEQRIIKRYLDYRIKNI